MKIRQCIAVLFLLAGSVRADEQPAEVLLFGVFHFANPGLDAVRVDQIDVLTPDNQVYLNQLAMRLCAFRPTAVLLEFDPARDQEFQSQLDAYLEDDFDLKSNEIYQIGFRVAEACRVTAIHGFDERQIQWGGDLLLQYLKESEPELLDTMNAQIAEIQESMAQAHQTLSLRELLIHANDPQDDRLNKDLYLLTNVAGAGDGFEGADATARWWHRNIRMYANIQKHATAGERLLVIAGQGHTAILKDLLDIDRRLVARDILPYL